MMSFTTTLLALVGAGALLATAHPSHSHGSGSGAVEIVPRKVLNATTGAVGVSNDTSNAEDNIPTFQAAACVCPPAVCDSRLNAKSQCQCKAQALLACYIKSAGACPKPLENTCS